MATPSSLARVEHVLLVLSGKGGVGKSSVTTQLALSLALQGKRVGVLDIDLTGPSVPRFFGVEGAQVRQSEHGWVPVPVPVLAGALSVMSLGFLLANRGDSVVWRGPKKTAMIRQFLLDVYWGELDYLLIDTPPGTSDEHIAIAEELQHAKVDGAVVVTTPQAVAVNDVKKEMDFCRKVGFAVVGIVENMLGYVCPCCGEVTDVFSKGGGEALAQEWNVRLLGKIPLDPQFVETIEGGKVGETYGGTVMYGVFRGVVEQVVSVVEPPEPAATN